MSVSRSELREKIMTILYQFEMYKRSKYEYNIEDVIKENVDIKSEFVDSIVNGVLDKQVELDEIANKVKFFPLEWVKNGCDISDEFIKYALPLVCEEPHYEFVNGLPRFTKLAKHKVK